METRDTSEFHEQITATRPYPNTQYEQAPVEQTSVRPNYYRSANIIYVVFGLLELTLALRFLFLLFGANRSSGFVTFVYTLSSFFVSPFYGIFGSTSYNRSFFYPATIIAMLIYAVVAWALIRLVAAANKQPADPV
jgi:hypothetical protein